MSFRASAVEIIGLALGLCFAGTAAAQVPDPGVLEPDTVESSPVQVDLPVSPRGAFFRSLVLPGWGQAYVGAPGRGAVYFSLTAGSVFMSVVSHQQLRDARLEQAWLRDIGQIGIDDETEFVEARARQFEDWVAFSVFMFFFSGADAYVAAYLSDFDERVGIRPGADGSLRLEARLPIGGR